MERKTLMSHTKKPLRQKTQEELIREQQTRRVVSIAAAVVVVIAAAFATWYFLVPRYGDISGVYTCKLTDSAYEMKLEFTPENGTYVQTVDGESAASGTYTVHGDTLITNATGEGKKRYFIEDDSQTLIPVDYLYSGTVPDGDTFEGTFQRTGKDKSKTTFEFYSDGTYTATIVIKNSDPDASTPETTTMSNGRYTREGDSITRVNVSEDGKETEVPLLFVHEGRLCNYCFRK